MSDNCVRVACVTAKSVWSVYGSAAISPANLRVSSYQPGYCLGQPAYMCQSTGQQLSAQLIYGSTTISPASVWVNLPICVSLRVSSYQPS